MENLLLQKEKPYDPVQTSTINNNGLHMSSIEAIKYIKSTYNLRLYNLSWKKNKENWIKNSQKQVVTIHGQ